MTGFTMPLGKKEVFFVTNRQRKTQELASEILRKLELPDNPDTRREVLYWAQKATLERVTLPSGVKYWEVWGKGFCSTFFDGDIVIIEL